MSNVVSLEAFKARKAEAAKADAPAAGTAEISLAAEQPPGLDVDALRKAYEANEARLREERARKNAEVTRDYGLEPKPGGPK